MPAQLFYIIMTGFKCNNNCLMCSVDNFRKKFDDRTTEEILAELRRGRQSGFERVEFTGGEPTVRPDFLALVGEAKKLGYKIINTGTNGRLFSYRQFCHEAFKQGLAGVNFALHGSSAKLHDAITRTPGSFRQTVQGIKNVLKEPLLKDVYLLSVISRLNIGDIGNLAKLVRSVGIEKWNLLNLIPEGAAEKIYKNIAVSLEGISLKFNQNFQDISSAPEIYFFDFPFCIFSEVFRNNANQFRFINAKERKENAKQIGYGVKSVRQVGSRYVDRRRVRLPICRHCRYDSECGGIWKKYIQIFNAKTIEKKVADLARRNNCLEISD